MVTIETEAGFYGRKWGWLSGKGGQVQTRVEKKMADGGYKTETPKMKLWRKISTFFFYLLSLQLQERASSFVNLYEEGWNTAIFIPLTYNPCTWCSQIGFEIWTVESIKIYYWRLWRFYWEKLGRLRRKWYLIAIKGWSLINVDRIGRNNFYSKCEVERKNTIISQFQSKKIFEIPFVKVLAYS